MGQISFVLLFCFSDFQNFTRFSFYHQIDQVFIIVLILIFRLFWPFSDFQIFRFSDFQIFRFFVRSAIKPMSCLIYSQSCLLSPLLSSARNSQRIAEIIIRFLVFQSFLFYFFLSAKRRKPQNKNTAKLKSIAAQHSREY